MAKQKRYSAQLKFQVVMESLHRKQPDAESARAYGVHAITLAKLKNMAPRCSEAHGSPTPRVESGAT